MAQIVTCVQHPQIIQVADFEAVRPDHARTSTGQIISPIRHPAIKSRHSHQVLTWKKR
ncbi:hypothetical protein DsansV1_C38g0236361 [Dioscorea sansibarensis]